MASLDGLPPLPKSLSALMTASSSQWKEMERLHQMKAMIQQDLPTNVRPAIRPGNLDASIAILRREMVQLRQLDTSLLCQLWSLNESLHEFKAQVQEGMYDSVHSERSEPLYENTNGIQEEDEEQETEGESDEEGIHREEINAGIGLSSDTASEESESYWTPPGEGTSSANQTSSNSPSPPRESPAARSNWAFFSQSDMNGFAL